MLELTRALVRGALDRHRLDLLEAFERDVCRTAGVLEDGRGEHAGTLAGACIDLKPVNG